MATVFVISKTLETEYYLPQNKENTFVDNGPQMCCKLGLPPLLTKSQNKKELPHFDIFQFSGHISV